jgi:threonine synthase
MVVAEHLLPAGSFKIRGAEAVVADALRVGAGRVALESSGNAGFAVALLARRAGIPAVVRVAGTIIPEKERLLRAAGADVEKYESREDAQSAGRADAQSYDASHVRNPLFRKGVATLATEWRRHAEPPPRIYLPVGNGSLLLGLWEGFRALFDSRRIARMPQLVAVQAEHCAPIARPEDPGDGETAADGCAILHPPAREGILEAIAASGGRVITVTEEEIALSQVQAQSDGFAIEPTAALAFAAAERLRADGIPAAVISTGAAVKTL